MKTAKRTGGNRSTKDVILSMVRRKPCTIRQIARSCAASSNEVVKHLSDMVRNGQIAVKSADDQLLVVNAIPLNQKQPES